MKTHAISKDSVSLITVAEHEAGQRLDNYLIKILKGVPKSHIHRIIRAGEVRLNKKRCKPDSRIQTGDLLRIPPVRTAEKQRSSENRAQAVPAREFTIIYEDDALLVIDKPAGTAVHGGSGVSFGVIEQIRRARPEARYLELVHRLDKDTSGLLMIAKKRSALVKLHEAIRNDHPKKIYLALGVGKLPNDSFHVKLPLFKYTGAQGEKMVRVSEDGQSAHTIFRVLNRFSDGLRTCLAFLSEVSADADWPQGKAQNAGNSGTIVKFRNAAGRLRCVSGVRARDTKQVLRVFRFINSCFHS